MSDLSLTDKERGAFYREITRNMALDYFFVFDSAPLHFLYRDKVLPGELTDIEKRNKIVTETVWTSAYHEYLICNVAYLFLYRGAVLQMPLQVHEVGTGIFAAPPEDDSRVYVSAEGVEANFNAFMKDKGWRIIEKARQSDPRGSWQTVVSLPDRTMRIASLIPSGNHAVVELIVTWSEDGVLKQTAFAAVLIYDVDGTVLMDRSYIEMSAWPSGRRYSYERSRAPQDRPQTSGVMDEYYRYSKDHQLDITLSRPEQRNLSIVEGAWLDTWNTSTGFSTEVFHPERFRTQLPLQKCSFNLDVSAAVLTLAKEAAPDSEMRIGQTYAKGNQVAVEGIVSWHRDGITRESPFLSILLLDEDGLIIRERRYMTRENWPGADEVMTRLGL